MVARQSTLRYFRAKAESTTTAIRIQPDVLYADEQDTLTSAGSAAGIDLCLRIIRKDFGTVVANNVAQRAVVSPHREGGQAQFIDKPVGKKPIPGFHVYWSGRTRGCTHK
jgi:AraC family transcriptional activator FtrA